MKVLRIEVFQETAHFHIPYSYFPYQTYLVPPYSTIVGFLLKLLGVNKHIEEEEIKKLLGEQLKLGIATTFEAKIDEYIQNRNLSIDKSREERIKFKIDQFKRSNQLYEVESLGRVLPVHVETLFEVRHLIYLYQESEELRNAVISISRLDPNSKIKELLSFGRSEDLVLSVNAKEVKLNWNVFFGKSKYYFLIPQRAYVEEGKDSSFYEKLGGIPMLIPSMYTIKDGHRVFKKERAKLSNLIHVKETFTYVDVLENQEKVPVFLLRLF